MNIEVWKPVVGFESKYVISNLGKVKRIKSNKILKVSINKSGYGCIVLNDKRRKSYLIHRLIADHFIPNPSNLPQINHINGDKLDNRLENLEWITALDNTRHAEDIGIRYKGKSKPVLCFTLDKEFVGEFSSGCQCAKYTNTTQRRVWECCEGERISYNGLIFMYKFPET